VAILNTFSPQNAKWHR